MRPVKLAISSLTHAHVRKYYATLSENRKLDWVAVSCNDPETIDFFKTFGYDIPIYPTLEEMLVAHPEIDGVVMASSNEKHLEEMRVCCKYHKAVLCMKVPSFDPAEYDEMIRLSKEADIICQVELELHYNPTVKRLMQLIDEKSVGDLVSFNATNITLSPVWAFPWQGDPDRAYGKRVPLQEGDPRFRGGALADHPHIFDLIRWATHSEFKFVYAEVAENIRDIPEEDVLLVTGEMQNGVKFVLDPSWSRTETKIPRPTVGWEVFPKRMEVNFTVVGENGVIQCDAFGPNVYYCGGPNDRFTIQYTYFDEWIGMMDEFCDCILSHKQPKITLEWHQKTVDAMNACYESIQTGKPVYLNGGNA